MPAFVRALREHDEGRCGALTKPELRTAMLRLGLRVDGGSNLDRAWDALTERDSGGGGNLKGFVTPRVSLDRLVGSVGSFESVPQRPRYLVRRCVTFAVLSTSCGAPLCPLRFS